MGNTRWTKEQQRAIVTSGCNLLVAAAAGAGKTAVLVERIIKKVTDSKDPIDIDRLLVVTFTNAAASEMRERIGDALSTELEKNPNSQRLLRQAALLNRSYIITIHSFCLDVIRNYFHSIDLDPAFRIADGTECSLLKKDALGEIFDEVYEDGSLSEDFLNLVECYGGGRGDDALSDMVLRLFEFSQSMPKPDRWINEMVEKFNPSDDFDFNASTWAGILMDNISIELSGLKSMMDRAVSLTKKVPSLEPYYNHLITEAQMVGDLLTCSNESWDKLYQAFLALDFANLPRSKKDIDKETLEKAKAIRDEVKKRVKKLKEETLTSSSKDIAEQMKKLYPSMACIGELCMRFAKRYGQKKKEKGIIDFSDIEHYCIDILTEEDEEGEFTPSKAAYYYREKFYEILIDEYQDSNMVQELILSTVSRKGPDEHNVFMVGDVKQSIYRFRQAKPELFLEKYSTYSDEDVNRDRRILLYKNFRSRKEVIEGANYIFKGIMSKDIGELDYDNNEKLNPGADYGEAVDGINYGGPVELHVIESSAQDEENEPSDEETSEDLAEEDEDVDKIQLEARLVAKRIKELMGQDGKGFTVYERGSRTYRPLEYRDIVILMRATSSAAPVFMEELSQRSIPIFADTASGYFEETEIQTVMSLLQIVDNPMQDIPLLSVLRSPIIGFTSEELIDIRNADNKRSIYEALLTKAKESDDTALRCSEFLARLKAWRHKALNMSISEFVWYLYSDTGYYAYVGAMQGGLKRQANLRVLFERARQYEDTSFKGLFNFINFINKLKKNNGDMGSAKVVGENENVVRIMSIHKSKGLEFPVVFVCGMGKKFNMTDLNKSILFHHDLGFGPDYVDSKKRYYYQTIIKQALKKKIKIESLSEEMRILYVALTRAKEKLIMTGTVRSLEKACIKWAESLESQEEKIPKHQVINGSTFLDWVCPVLMRHRDCSLLRDMAGTGSFSHDMKADEESKWDVKLWTRKEVLSEYGRNVKDEAAAGLEIVEEVPDEQLVNEIRKRLEWEYPYIKSSKIPAKLTVTELKRRFGSNLDEEYSESIFLQPLALKPSFMEDKGGLSSAERGTLMHLVMEHIDLSRAPSHEEVRELVEKLVSQEFMTQVQSKAININRVVNLFKSPLGQRMVKSGNAKREIPFYIEIGSTEVFTGLGEDYKNEKILLQGVIDCYFEEDNGIVLIDYKTDYVESAESILEKYKVQIDYYTRALEKITGKTVKEKYIYLFYNGEILEF